MLLAEGKKGKAQKELSRIELQRRDLKFFILGIDGSKGAWDILEPNTEQDWNWHHSLIVEYLTEIYNGNTRRLLINVAPRTLKSLIVSVFFPCWVWLTQPWESFLCLSYSTPLANDHSYKRQEILESDWYCQLAHGRRYLTTGRNRVTEYSNSFGGTMYARGLDGSVTGVGGTYILCDDPNDAEKAESEADREGKLKRFRSYMTTRANNPKKTKVLVVQQRTHESDVSGYILNRINKTSTESLAFKVVKLPTRAPVDEIITFPISGEKEPRLAGSLLHSSRFGEDEDIEARRELGAYGYSARHDQEPAPLEGGVFSGAVWQTFTSLPENYRLYISGDLSFGSTSNTASFVAIGLIAEAYPNFYLIDLFHERCGFSKSKQAIKSLVENNALEYGLPNKILIEKKASGSTMIEVLKEELTGVLPFNPDSYGSKLQRAESVAPIFEAGNFYIKDGAKWLDTVKMEFIKFQVCDSDDIVDMVGQLMIYVRENHIKYMNQSVPIGHYT